MFSIANRNMGSQYICKKNFYLGFLYQAKQLDKKYILRQKRPLKKQRQEIQTLRIPALLNHYEYKQITTTYLPTYSIHCVH